MVWEKYGSMAQTPALGTATDPGMLRCVQEITPLGHKQEGPEEINNPRSRSGRINEGWKFSLLSWRESGAERILDHVWSSNWGPAPTSSYGVRSYCPVGELLRVRWTETTVRRHVWEVIGRGRSISQLVHSVPDLDLSDQAMISI